MTMRNFYLFLICFVGFISPAFAKAPSAEEINQRGFGTIFTPHMFVMEWSQDHGWHNARIQDYKPFSFDPASLHMHYAQTIFEGIKAFRMTSGECALFRPRDHLKRMNSSARIMSMPEIDVDEVLIYLKALVSLDADWVPGLKGTSLYIRPSMIATEATLNLKASEKYTFFILLSPVGSFYQNGFNTVPIFVCDQYTRASFGGVGEAKTGGNYGAGLRAQKLAKKEGCAQVLWLDPQERTYVEEVGTMNIFFVIDDEVVTPALSGSILAGITRKSILALGNKWGLNMSERKISIDEVIKAVQEGRLTEAFGTGTAAAIAPIGKLKYKGVVYTINDNQVGPITQSLYDALCGIQYGTEQDEDGWLELIE